MHFVLKISRTQILPLSATMKFLFSSTKIYFKIKLMHIAISFFFFLFSLIYKERLIFSIQFIQLRFVIGALSVLMMGKFSHAIMLPHEPNKCLFFGELYR